MKYLVGVLFCAAIAGGAPIVYDDPVRVTGGGFAYWENIGGGAIQGGFNIVFGGASDDGRIGVQVSHDRGDNIGSLGASGLTNIHTAGPASFAQILLGIDGSLPFVEHSSPYFYYDLGLDGVGLLTLTDALDQPTVSIPLLGKFNAIVIEHRVSPDGRELVRYRTEVLPIPEPATWVLMGSSYLIAFAFWGRLRRNCANQVDRD